MNVSLMTTNSVLYVYRVSEDLRSILRDLIPELMMNTRGGLLQRILSAARCINKAAVLLKFTIPLVTRVRKFIYADGGHSEQLA